MSAATAQPASPPRVPAARSVSDAALTWRLTIAALRRFSSTRGLGSLWWVVDPLVMIAVYAVVLGQIVGLVDRWNLQSYPLFLSCGLVVWRWQTVSTTRGANALLANAGLLSGSPVRPESVLVSEVWASTIEALFGIPVLLAFMLWFEVPLTWNLLWLPLPLAILGSLIFAASHALSVLTVLVRDTGNAWAALLRVVWFLSPGLYGYDHFPERWRVVWSWANPFVGILEGVRRPIHDGLPPLWEPLAASAVWALVSLLVGRWVFRRLQNEAVRQLG